MVNILFFGIANDSKLMEEWVSPQRRIKLRGFGDKVMRKVTNSKSITIRSIQLDGLWVYYFQQESFLFMLAADGLQVRSVRMQNYLRILTQIFYENYDENRFPTVLDRIITEINQIQNKELSHEQHEGLISGYSLTNQKEKFSQLIAQKQRNSQRAYWISAILFIAIVGLAVYYLRRKS